MLTGMYSFGEMRKILGTLEVPKSVRICMGVVNVFIIVVFFLVSDNVDGCSDTDI